MFTLDAVSAAILLARRNGSLKITREHNARLGVAFIAIADDRGLITTALSDAEAIALLGGGSIAPVDGLPPFAPSSWMLDRMVESAEAKFDAARALAVAK